MTDEEFLINPKADIQAFQSTMNVMKKYNYSGTSKVRGVEMTAEEQTKKTWLEDYLENDCLVTRSEFYIAKTSIKDFCKKILEEVRTHEGIEQMTKFYIAEIIKDLGVEV